MVPAPKKWILGWYWGFSGGFYPFWKEFLLKEHGQKEPGLLQNQAWSQVGKATWPAAQATPCSFPLPPPFLSHLEDQLKHLSPSGLCWDCTSSWSGSLPATTSFPGNLEARPHLAVQRSCAPHAQADMLFSKPILCSPRPSGASTASRAAGSCTHIRHPLLPGYPLPGRHCLQPHPQESSEPSGLFHLIQPPDFPCKYLLFSFPAHFCARVVSAHLGTSLSVLR